MNVSILRGFIENSVNPLNHNENKFLMLGKDYPTSLSLSSAKTFIIFFVTLKYFIQKYNKKDNPIV